MADDAAAAGIEDALKALEAFLRPQGLKMTEQRRQLVRAALRHPGHFTAEELHDTLRAGGRDVSMATVYRSLGVLEEAGILEGHDFEDGQRRFEPRLAREHHDHMVCTTCRAVVEFQSAAIERLQEKVAREHGFAIREHHLTLYVECSAWTRTGRCPRREQAGGALP